MKHISTFLTMGIALILLSASAWGQQVIGTFPTMDGGFEAEAVGAVPAASSIATGVQTANWTVQTAGTGTIISGGARTGSRYMNAFTPSTAKRWQSPTVGSGAITNVQYTVQYYYRTVGATGTAASMQIGGSPDGTGSPTYFPSSTPYATLAGTSGAWVKNSAQVTLSTAGGAGKYGIGIIRANTPTMGTAIDVDDFVMYQGTADVTAPDPATLASAANPTTSSLDISWTAPGTGVDGGGYIVVRKQGSDPTTTPNTNGIYAVGNTVATGEQVVYVGTGTSFTDGSLSSGTQYYYRVYTVDKAFNYSTAATANGTTSVPTPVTDAPVVSSPIAEGATSVSGTSTEADGTTIDVYVDGLSVGTTTVSSNAWTKTGMTALTVGQQVKAKATASGELESAFSNTVTVQAYTAVPVVSSPIGEGATSVSGTSSEADGTTIDVYVDGSSVGTTTVTSNAWTKTGLTALTAGQQVKAKATASGELESGFSSIVTVQQVSAAPVVSSPIAEGATLVSGTSTEADGTTIDVYVDGSSVGTTTVASNAWTKSGMTTLNAGQQVKAKATASGKLESGFSNTVTVQAYTSAPTVGSPISQGATAVSGTSTEANGTTIDVYVDGSSVGTTTVSSNAWTKTGLTVLTVGQQVKAKATASGKLESGFSNIVTVTAGLGITTASPLPNATAGASYSQTLTASGGTAPYGNWQVISGSLPPSMNLNSSTGEISGTSTVAGTYNFTVAVTDAAPTTVNKAFSLTVDPGSLHHFAIGTISTPQIAGTAFSVAITAQDANNNTVTGFTGTVGLSTTAGTIAPTTSGSFVLGVRNENVAVTQSGTGKTIGVDDGSGHTATSNTFDVDPGAVHHFAIGTISTPQVAGTSFGITITAQDLNNNTVTVFVGTVGLTTTAGTISPTTSAPFVLGIGNENVTVTLAGTGKTISVDDGSGHTGISNAFDVNSGSVDHFAIGTITSPQIAGTPFNLVMTAKDLNNNTVPAFVGTVTISLSSGTISPTTSGGFVSGARTEPVIISTGGTGLTISIDDGSTHTGTSNSFDVTVPIPYRSAVAAGNWGDASSWEIFNGSTWVAASAAPTTADGAITILTGDTIVVSAPVTADQVTVDAGGVLTVAASQTLTVANAADSVDMVVFGTVNNIGTVTATGRISFENGALYKHNTASATTAAATTTWRTGSTFEINNGAAPGNLNQHALYNLVVNPGTTMGANGGPNFPNNYVLYGSLTVTSSNSVQWRLANLSAGLTTNIFIRGNVTVNGSTAILTSTGSGADTAAKAVINVDGNVNVTAGQWSLNNSSAAYAEWKVKGNISITGGTLQSGTSGWYGRRTLNFAGGGTQSLTVSAPGTIGTAATTFKVSNGSTVNVNFPWTLMTNGALNLESGKFATTATNVITLPATGTVIGGNSSAYVDGPLVQTVASASATTKTFPIGKGSAYRPVTLTVNQDAATATPYTAEVFNTAPVSRTLPSSLLSVSSVRYVSLVKGAGAGLSPTLGATIQMSYGVDDGVADAALLRVAKDSGSTYWANLGGSGTGTPSGTITSNAFFAFSDFVLATADTTTPALLPTIATTAMSYISTTTARSGGNVTNDGGAAVSARGVCWNTTGAPTVSDSKTIDGTGAGPFMSSLTGLTPGITYHLRAYATNSAGSGYGNEVVFSTLATLIPPTVTTTALSDIQVTTAVSGGSVTDWGGDSVTVRGICWNTSGNPTISGSHTIDGAGLGSFVSGLYPLTGGTLYYVRAYATNSAGTGYGNELSFTTQTPQPDVNKVVAQDGSGDYLTVQAAFNAVPANFTGKWTIFVKNGVYYEKLLLASTKINVILVGQNKDSTILTYDDYADRYGSGNPGTSGSYSVAIDASDFMARNITFRNTYSPQPGVSGTQAVALRTQGDRHQFINCKILGYQDTYYTWGGSGTGRTYHKDCYIEGTVDFIFGRNIVVFDNCTIHEIRNAATITAGATDLTSQYGYVFRNCSIITDPIGYDGVPITTTYLGRPWQASPRTVFINSYEPSSLVAAGWQSWNVTPGLYAEFNCYGPGSATGGRVAWSSQLSGPVAATYSLSNIFARNSASSNLILYDWMPDSAATNLPLAIRLTSSAGANGSISPAGATNIIYGGNQTFTITPIPNYHVADVLVDGVSVGAVTSHSITGATSNHSISATFAIDTYAITATAGSNGSITPSGSVVVNHGADQQFTFTPNSGYHVDSVFVDGGHVDSISSYTFTNVTANHSISATFIVNPPNQFTLTIAAVNGTVTKNPNAPTYDSASTVHLTANPAVGYHFVNWTGDLTGSNNPDSILMNANKSVTANFAINTYILDVTATNGTVVLNPATGPYIHGTVVTLTATPTAGYHFGGWTGSLTSSNNPDSIVMDGNKSVTANFIVNPTIIQSNGTGGGLWSSASTWQYGLVPGDLDTVVIVGSDSVVVGVTDSCLRVGVQSGAKLALVDTLKVGTVGVSGRLINFKVLAASGTVVFDSGSVYQHAQINGSIPVATWNPGSTCMVTGYVSGSKPSNSNQNFYNFTWNCPGQTATVDIAWFNNTIYGDINIPSTGTGRLQLTSPGAGSPNTITIMGNISFASGNFTSNGSSSAATITIEDHGNITVTGGNFSATRGSGPVVSWNLYGNMVMSNATTQNSNASSRFVFKKVGTQTLALSNMSFAGGGLPVEVSNGTTLDAGTSTIRGSGAFTLNAGATLQYANAGGIDSLLAGTGTKTLNVGANYLFNGSVAQVTGVLMPGTVNNLTIGNAAGVTLTDTIQVNGTLVFVNGKLNTGVNLAIVGASGSVSGASPGKYVHGRMMKTVPVSGGAGSQTYEIGDASAYTPILIAGSSYASPFDVLATSTGVEHPGIYGSGIDSARSVNRYYTLRGIPTGPSDITCNFVAGDVDAAANTNNFVVGKYDSPTWTLPTVGTRTATSTQALGVTSLSDFAIGEVLPPDTTRPSIVYNLVSSTNSTGARVLTATIKDNVAVDSSALGGPRLWYRSATTLPLAGAYTPVVGARVAPGDTNWTFAFPAFVSGTFVDYYVAAQDYGAPINVATVPAGTAYTNTPPNGTVAAPNYFAVKSPLTFTVGASGADFTSITDVMTWLYPGIDGPVQILLNSNYTSAGEIAPIYIGGIVGLGLRPTTGPAISVEDPSLVLPSIHSRPGGARGIPGLGAKTSSDAMLITNTLTIKPNTGATPGPISGVESVNGGMIYMEAVSGVTIEGLTVENTGTYAAIFLGWGVSENRIVNCTLKSSCSAGNAVGTIWLYNAFPGGGNVFDNCDISAVGGFNGIAVRNAGISVNDTVRNCHIHDFGFNSATSQLGYGMRLLNGTTNMVIENNQIYDVVPYVGATTFAKAGISIGSTLLEPMVGTIVRNNIIRDLNAVTANSVFGVTVGGFNVNGLLVEGNTIRDLGATTVMGGAGPVIRGVTTAAGTNIIWSRNTIKDLHTATVGALVMGARVSANVGVQKNTFENNMIVLGNAGSNADISYQGISDAGSTDDTTVVAYNSVYIGGLASTGTTDGYIRSGTGTSTLRNNILHNQRSGGVANYAIRSTPVSGGVFNSNYNDVYADGGGGVLGAFAGVDQVTLAAWQTASGGDANSANADPLYVDPLLTANLHITSSSSPASNTGTPVAGITVDFDGDLRNATTPDMGADEFASSMTVGVPVALSWNIVSLPVAAPVPDDSVQHIFTNSVNKYGFAFVGGYVQQYVMTNGPALWIKSSAGYTQNITGSRRDTLTVPVNNGWNMIGSISTSIDTSAARVTPSVPGLRGSNFFKYLGGYVIATTIEPGLGYWVRANSAGSFYMHATGPAMKATEPMVGEGIGNLNSITIRDANGGSQTLYFGADAGGEIPVAMYAMPPAPPVGAFDARFSAADGGSMVQTHAVKVSDALEFPVTVQSVAYPLTVTWNVNKGTASYELADGMGGQVFRAKEMRGEGSIKITNSGVSKFSIKLVGDGQLPKEFALSQNYPNPFNPTTSIKYALPVDSKLTMEIYNVLGQRVRTLVSDNVVAGYHVAEWNGMGNAGQPLASGVYFLQISAKGTNGKTFSDTRKLVMLK